MSQLITSDGQSIGASASALVLPMDIQLTVRELSVCAKSLQSCFFVTAWTEACQVPLSMGFSRQEYWSGLPCPPLGDLPDPGIEPGFLMSPALAGEFFTTSASRSCLVTG